VLVESDVELASRTTLRVGGRARFFARVQSETELAEALEFADRESLGVRVLGGGSNVVVPDRGVDALVLSIAIRGLGIERRGERARLTACAGEPWDEVVRASTDADLGGLECLSGIPGWVGATPIQNVGAYGQEIADTLLEVRAFDRAERRFVVLAASECAFGYRDSRFKSAEPERFVVTEVAFELRAGHVREVRYPELNRALRALGRAPELRDVREAVLALRRQKSMLLDPGDPNARSCGSFFVNPSVPPELALEVERRFADPTMPRYPQPDGRVKLSAAWLIERSGFARGTRSGQVGLSSRHALALVCHDGASAEELLAFARTIQASVRERSGVELTPEPVFW